MVASVHNTRILRFFIILAAVVLTIFIYASYSSSASMAPPPHMRSAMMAAQLQQEKQQQLHNRTLLGEVSAVSMNKNNNYLASLRYDVAPANAAVAVNDVAATIDFNLNATHAHLAKVKKKSVKQHREPTIAEDARGGGGGGIANVPYDDMSLDHFVNIDLLEEQYAQTADNMLGNNNNNSLNLSATQLQTTNQLQQQLQLQPQQQQIDLLQSQQQQQQQQQMTDNNLNKIPDSDVLIPTSNLQKFIENADKILKNITALSAQQELISAPATAAVSAVNNNSNNNNNTVSKLADKEHSAVEQKQKQQRPQQLQQQEQDHVQIVSENENVGVDLLLDDLPQPPSVVMATKHNVASAAAPSAVQSTKTAAVASASAPVSSARALARVAAVSATSMAKPKVPVNVPQVPVDTTKGIPTSQIYEGGHKNEELNIEQICPNQGDGLKLLILITSAQMHTEARLAIRQTWAHYGMRRDVSTAFVLGRNANETQNLALTQENFIYGDLIRGNFIDSYNNLTLKTISSLEWVDQHCPKVKYLLKTDDDMFINVPKLLAFLDSHAKDKRTIFGRLAKKWKPIRNKKSKYYVSPGQFAAQVFPPFNTGPAYVLTGDIVHELYTHALSQVYLKLEDVFTTGIVAQQLGIKRVHVNEFLNRRIPFNPCNIRKSISVHMIKANEQFDLWKKLLDQSTKCK